MWAFPCYICCIVLEATSLFAVFYFRLLPPKLVREWKALFVEGKPLYLPSVSTFSIDCLFDWCSWLNDCVSIDLVIKRSHRWLVDSYIQWMSHLVLNGAVIHCLWINWPVIDCLIDLADWMIVFLLIWWLSDRIIG